MLKQIDAGVLNVSYSESGSANFILPEHEGYLLGFGCLSHNYQNR